MRYLLNAFPNSFLPQPGQELFIRGLLEADASKILEGGFVSAVGHESFATVLANRLGVPVPVNRIAITPTKGDAVVVAAVSPPRRLPEGEVWSEEEILTMPIVYSLILF